MGKRAPDPASLVAASAAVFLAAARVWWYEPRLDLPGLVDRLRAVHVRATRSLDPAVAAAVLERLIAVVPPWNIGRCMKRSLILLDVWSRAALSPRLHLGFREEARREPHAWVTASSGLVGGAPGAVETWQG